ncbi:hypothetical protein Tco_0091745 [Tanacetum coccineum]
MVASCSSGELLLSSGCLPAVMNRLWRVAQKASCLLSRRFANSGFEKDNGENIYESLRRTFRWDGRVQMLLLEVLGMQFNRSSSGESLTTFRCIGKERMQTQLNSKFVKTNIYLLPDGVDFIMKSNLTRGLKSQSVISLDKAMVGRESYVQVVRGRYNVNNQEIPFQRETMQEGKWCSWPSDFNVSDYFKDKLISNAKTRRVVHVTG